MFNYNNTATKKVAVFCYGNPSRGDDALAPLMFDYLEAQFADRDDILLINDFQLQVEHILDLQQAEIALFIDAQLNGDNAFDFYQLDVSDQLSHTSHALVPADLLGFYQQSLKSAPPPAFVLAITGESFELGEKLTSKAAENLVVAQSFSNELLQAIDLDNWQAQL